jgi:hypothetical protein
MHAITHDAPITRDMYARVLELLGDERPAGLVVHLALELPEGGLRYVDVWESEEASETFRSTRLGPAVGRMLSEHGIPVDEGAGPEGPDHADTLVLGVVDVMLGAAADATAGAAGSAGVTAGAAARPS